MNPFKQSGELARVYVVARPSYPDSLIDLATRNLVPNMSRIADIGAGTGKLTRQLAVRGFEVDAIEPAADMRDAFEQMVVDSPAVHLLPGTGEHTLLPDRSVDLVIFGQSWHWMDPRLAGAEAARILTPGGRIAALVNQLDVSYPWVKRLTRVMRSGDVHRATKPPEWGRRFTRPRLAQTTWVDRMSPEKLRALGTTRSSWIKNDDAGRAHMRANLDAFIKEMGYRSNDLIEVPYLSYLWVSELS